MSERRFASDEGNEDDDEDDDSEEEEGQDEDDNDDNNWSNCLTIYAFELWPFKKYYRLQ